MVARTWSAQEIELLLAWRKESRTTWDIAERLERTDPAVRLKLLTLGLSSANPVRARGPVVKEAAPSAPAAPEAFPPVAAVLPELEPPPARPLIDTSMEDDLRQGREALIIEEARASKRKYQEVLRQSALEDRIVGAFGERIMPFDVRCSPPPPSAVRSADPESAVLLISDTHIGQVVSSEQTGGFGDYNVRRFLERLYFVEQSVRDALNGDGGRPVDELVVFLLGDILHGALDHGAEREESLLLADQFIIAISALHQFLLRLAALTPRMRIHTVVGNHGRWPGQKRVPTVNRYSNLDHLVYGALERSLAAAGVKHIQFILNQAPRQITNIKGWNFLASHGDHLRGGDKQLAVPIHAIAREISATTQRQAAANKTAIDYFVIGDKHKHVSLPTARGNFIINGAFPGVDEFSYQYPPCEPLQLLLFVHPRMRRTWQHEIKLEFAPRLDALPYDLPPHVRYLAEEDAGASASSFVSPLTAS